jgi:hypothetical protein
MFKNFIKLSRRFLILAFLAGSLVFVFGMQPKPAQALGGKCCWECDADADTCDHVCDFLPHSPLCASCQVDVANCYLLCNPDPNC